MSVKRYVKTLGVITTIGMFLVLIMGATVTSTGSEQGCGHDWPLCRGRFVPQFAVSTAIEYAHRVDAAIETILILALASGALYLYRQHREIQILAPLMVGFLFLQAGLGAWAVAYPQMAVALALHFGVSLIAFASVLLTTVFLFEVENHEELRERPVPTSFRRLAWAVTGYSYVVVYLGAYVRHTQADLACKDWPLCNGSLVPVFKNGVGANVIHRVAAGLLVVVVLSLLLWSRQLRYSRPDLYRASLLATGAVALQSLSGAVVVFTRVDLFSALMHAALAGLLFGALTYLSVHVLPRHEPATADSRQPSLAPRPAGLRR